MVTIEEKYKRLLIIAGFVFCVHKLNKQPQCGPLNCEQCIDKFVGNDDFFKDDGRIK